MRSSQTCVVWGRNLKKSEFFVSVSLIPPSSDKISNQTGFSIWDRLWNWNFSFHRLNWMQHCWGKSNGKVKVSSYLGTRPERFLVAQSTYEEAIYEERSFMGFCEISTYFHWFRTRKYYLICYFHILIYWKGISLYLLFEV